MGLGFEGLKGDKGQKGDSGPPGTTAPIMPFEGVSEVTGPQGEAGLKGDKVRRRSIVDHLALRHRLTRLTFRVKLDRKDKKENQVS